MTIGTPTPWDQLIKGAKPASGVAPQDLPKNQPDAQVQTQQEVAPTTFQAGQWDYATSKLNLQGNALPAGAVGWQPDGQPYWGTPKSRFDLGPALKKFGWIMAGSPISGNQAENWTKLTASEAEQRAIEQQWQTHPMDMGILGQGPGEWKPDTPPEVKARYTALGNESTTRVLGFALGTDVQGNVITDPGLQAENKKISDELFSIGKQWMAGKAAGLPGATENWNPDTPADVKARYSELIKKQDAIQGSIANVTIPAGGKILGVPYALDTQHISLAQPLVRWVDTLIKIGGEELQQGGVLPERAMGAAEYLRAYNYRNDPNFIAGDNTAKQIVANWDTMRDIGPKNTFDALSKGWDAGRLLYTANIKPTVLAEYERQVQKGTDPYLAAEALKDPWTEMVGRTVFDATWLIGAENKGAKVAQLADEVGQDVKASALADELVKALNEARGPLSEASSYAVVQKMDAKIPEVIANVTKEVSPDFVTGAHLSAEGARVHFGKLIGDFFHDMTGAIMTRGKGTYADVGDLYTYLVKMADPDQATHLEGVTGLMSMREKFNLGTMPFNNDAVRSGVIIRSIADPEVLSKLPIAKEFKANNIIDLIAAAEGDPAKGEKIFGALMEQSIERQFPTYFDLQKAQKAVATGEYTAHDEQLAKTLSEIPGPNRFLLSIDAGTIGKARLWLNKVFGLHYFTTPGWVARNTMNNLLTTLVDNGLRPFVRDGRVVTDPFMDRTLQGYEVDKQSALAGFTKRESLASTQVGQNIVGRFNNAVEGWFAKRIYYSRFMDSMDNFLKPGVALPSAEVMGEKMSPSQIDQYVHILKYEAYGNTDKALEIFATKHGLNGEMAAWKNWMSAISPGEMKALDNAGYRSGFDELTKGDGSPQTIRDVAAAARKDLLAKAAPAAKMPVADVSGFGQAVHDGFLNGDNVDKLNTLIQARASATESLFEALTKVPPGQERGALDVIRGMFSPKDTGEASLWTKNLTQQTREYIAASKGATRNTLEILWSKSILHDTPIPDILNSRVLTQNLWDATFAATSAKWNTYFAKLEQVGPLVDQMKDPAIKALFNDAVKANAELQVRRTAVYSHGASYLDEAGKDGFFHWATDHGIDEATAQADLTSNGKMYQKYLEQTATKISPVHPANGAPMIGAENWQGNKNGLTTIINKVEDYMLKNYGMNAVDRSSPELLQHLKTIMTQVGADGKNVQTRANEAVAMADKIGKYWRDFGLLPYGETTNFDHATAWAMPYEFWYIGGGGGTYRNWMQRLSTDTGIVSAYFRLKSTMSNINKASPEWWRYNAVVPSHVLGTWPDHQLSFNLEASIWPLNGITGTDYTDPQKRVNIWTSTLDDMGKFGPSPHSAISIGTAVYLALTGQNDAAARWAGTMGQQYQTIKSVASKFGMYVEPDPLVRIFSGDMTPYEKDKMPAAIAALEQEGIITIQQGLDATRTQSGPIWDQAKLRMAQQSAPGQISSFLFGAGFKSRSADDMAVTQFYADYGKLQSLIHEKMISPDQIRQQYDALRQTYPFMDTLLLSSKAGKDGNTAYVYNVLARFPPGQINEVMNVIGVDKTTVQKFYDNGGDLSFMSPTEKDAFIAKMVDVAAMMAIPDYATKQEWNQAKQAYSDMQNEIVKSFGYDITQKLDDYWNATPDEKNAMVQTHPEIQQALNMQDALKSNSAVLTKYYGGIDTIARYEKAKLYTAMRDKYGPDIEQTVATWKGLLDILATKDAAAYKKAHPEIAKYQADLAKIYPEVDRRIALSGSFLSDAPLITLSGQGPVGPTQNAIANYANPAPAKTLTDFNSMLGDPMMKLIVDHFMNNKELSKSVQTTLDYQAKRYGYADGNALLQAVGIEVYRSAYGQ